MRTTSQLAALALTGLLTAGGIAGAAGMVGNNPLYRGAADDSAVTENPTEVAIATGGAILAKHRGTTANVFSNPIFEQATSSGLASGEPAPAGAVVLSNHNVG